VQNPLFKVSVAEIERNDVHKEWTIPSEWLTTQLVGSEATSQGTEGELVADFSKNGREILIQAKARVDVVMPCARTMDPVPLTVEPDIFLLLTPSGASAPTPKPTGKKSKSGRTRGDQAQAEELTDTDAAQDTYEGDHIVLDDFVREHILLELPAFPLRSDLRSEDSPAIRPPSTDGPIAAALDPRLAPLAMLASKMREKKE
jgi:uncharacterized protein